MLRGLVGIRPRSRLEVSIVFCFDARENRVLMCVGVVGESVGAGIYCSEEKDKLKLTRGRRNDEPILDRLRQRPNYPRCNHAKCR